jgi:hypothetical protein
LLGGKVFYVGMLPNEGEMEVSYAFQTSLNHHIGIENHRAEIERYERITGVENKIRLDRLTVTVPRITSSNHMFAEALFNASHSIEKSESELLDKRQKDTDEFDGFFASKADFDLHQANKPSDRDYAITSEYRGYNNVISEMFRGWFGGYRRGLVEPPRFSLLQSARNLLRLGGVRGVVKSDDFPERLSALKRMHNFSAVSKRVRSHGESEVLNQIADVASGDFDQRLEIVGIRLLDGYYYKKGYRRPRRVILGSPLYLA